MELQERLQVGDCERGDLVRLQLGQEFGFVGECRADEHAVGAGERRHFFCHFGAVGAVGFVEDRLCGFAFDDDAVAERAEDRVGNAVGFSVATGVLREEPEMRECIADGKFERRRIVAGRSCVEAIA